MLKKILEGKSIRKVILEGDEPSDITVDDILMVMQSIERSLSRKLTAAEIDTIITDYPMALEDARQGDENVSWRTVVEDMIYNLVGTEA